MNLTFELSSQRAMLLALRFLVISQPLVSQDPPPCNNENVPVIWHRVRQSETNEFKWYWDGGVNGAIFVDGDGEAYSPEDAADIVTDAIVQAFSNWRAATHSKISFARVYDSPSADVIIRFDLVRECETCNPMAAYGITDGTLRYVTINNVQTWTDDPVYAASRDDRPDIYSIIMHEFTHIFLGLGHSNISTAVTYTWTNPRRITRQLTDYDRCAIDRYYYRSFLTTVNQLSSTSQDIGYVQYHIGGSTFSDSLVGPADVPLYEELDAYVRADQGIIGGEKYQFWSVGAENAEDDVSNHHRFHVPYGGFPTDLYSYFQPTVGGVEIDLGFWEEIGAVEGLVSFRDPWLIDYADTALGGAMRNRGMLAPFKDRPAPFNPDFGSSFNGDVHKGVFLNMNYSIPDATYYSVKAPILQFIDGIGSCFLHWESTGASLRSPAKDTSAVTFSSGSAMVKALYKWHNRSTLSHPTSTNSQRKIGYIGAKYHMVYESAGDIWYCSSSDGGSTWSNEFLLSDGSGKNRGPSLGINQSLSSGPYLAVVWEMYDPWYSYIFVRRLSTSGVWGAVQQIGWSCPGPDFDGSEPVIALDDEFEVAAWKVKGDPEEFYPPSGIYVSLCGEDQWKVEGTDSNSKHPSVAVPGFRDLQGKWGIAWSQSYHIFYKSFNGGMGYATEYPSPAGPLREHDFPSLVLVPSLSYEVYPAIAWKAFETNEWGTDCVVARRKGAGGWGAIECYVNGVDFENPSLTRHEYPDTALAMVWHDGIGMYLAECAPEWGNQIELGEGIYPSLGFDESWTNTHFRILYTDRTSTPVAIASTSQGLQKRSPSAGEKRMLALTLEKGGTQQSILLKKLTLRSGEAASDIPLAPVPGLEPLKSRARVSEMLSGEPTLITSGSVLAVDIQTSTQMLVPVDVPSSPLSLQLRLSDAETGVTLFSQMLDTIGISARPVEDRTYSIGTTGLSEKYVRLSIVPVESDTTSGLWTAIVIHYDTAGSKIIYEPEIALRQKDSEIPTEYQLREPYPNPFNPTTTFRYELPVEGEVSLKVFDMLGRQVAELVHGAVEAGSHSVIWQSTALSSGTYIVRFQVSDQGGKPMYSKVTRAILLK